LALFDDAAGAVAEYQEGPCPEELAGRVDEIFGQPGPTFLTPDTPSRRYAWARGLTLMREKVTDLADARLVVGGKLENFSGVIPGVIEETYLSLKRGKPLFLIGGFGGAARAVCDQLRGIVRPEFTDAFSARTVRDYAACKELFAAHKVGFESMQDIGELISSKAPALSKAMNNGLNDEDNLELMRCKDAQRVFELVMKGTAAM
jgi:hypothetical protein